MSHFTTLVLFKKVPEDIESAVGEALAPFDEHITVAPYEEACYCIGRVAHRAAEKAAEAACGTLDQLRDSFWSNRPEGETEEENQAAWRRHIAEYSRIESEVFNAHPMKDKPDPTCGYYEGEFWQKEVQDGKLDPAMLGKRFTDGSGCGGTGVVTTTYNPKSKWDWYVIGGRWQGGLDPDYDPEKDPRNWETCPLCNGTGDREDLEPPEWKAKCGGCNGCHGKGVRIKFQLEPHDYGNVSLVHRLFHYNGTANRKLRRHSQKPRRAVRGPQFHTRLASFIPFAIITPDGQWHEHGRMGWWGIVTDEKEDWSTQASKILAKHKDCCAVLCDLHI